MSAELGSCPTFTSATHKLGQHTQGSQDNETDLDSLIQAQQAKLAALRKELLECGGGPETPVEEVIPVIEGAPVIAHSTGRYVAGTPSPPPPAPTVVEVDTQSTCGKGKGHGTKRALSFASPPEPEAVKVHKVSPPLQEPVETRPLQEPVAPVDPEMWHDAQDPNAMSPSMTYVQPPSPPPPSIPDQSPKSNAALPPLSPAPTTAENEGNVKDALFWKLRRHCVLKKSSCSEAAIQLWRTAEGRVKLRELMKKNGNNFADVEQEICRSYSKIFGEKKAGRWVTRSYLMNIMGYSKKMADATFDYCSKNNMVRNNEVHGEQEDPNGDFMAENSSLPGSSRLEILNHNHEVGGVSPEDQAAASSGSFKLVFPTIQQNESAVTVLPHFIEVCGRKLDNTVNVLEKLKAVKTHQAQEHAKQIEIHVNHMKSIYKKLENHQADCAVTRSARPETQKQILQLCAECTKNDVALNNLVLRARTFKPTSTKPGGSGSGARKSAAGKAKTAPKSVAKKAK